MKSSSYSVHPSVPILNLSLLSTSARAPKFKLRLHTRSSLTNMLQLPQILEQATQRGQTDRSQCSLLSHRTPSTLSVLAEVDEEQCKQRYLNDPFFRKKVQFEAKALNRSSTNAALQKGKDCWIGSQIQKTTKLIELSNDTTFRKVKQNEFSNLLQEKKKYDAFLWQVKGQQSQRKRQRIR